MDRWATKSERTIIINNMLPAAKDETEFLFGLGARPIELRRLKWSDVKLTSTGGTATLRHRKGSTNAWTPRDMALVGNTLAVMRRRYGEESLRKPTDLGDCAATSFYDKTHKDGPCEWDETGMRQLF